MELCVCDLSVLGSGQLPDYSNMFPFLRTWGEEWNRAIDDIGTYRRAYILTLVASYGGILFGWDTGLIGGILTTSAFQKSFALNPKSKDFKNLQGNIVSVSGVPKPFSHVYRLMLFQVLQGGCFFGAASSYYISDTLGRKRASLLQVGSFFSALYCRPVRA